ncbi:hypothetical protein ACU5EH_15465 [Aliivibrio salmonicida]|uniref:hypothetical protein n=1 Tax=Aliivibrio salmonicida TaxID=40269 RepID=UPI00406C8386
MSISLFEEIGKGGYQASLMTTFSVDFPFYEDLLLKKMQSKGVYHHVLLADKKMCQHVISHRPPKYAGKQYSLGLMQLSQAFHPKVFMLLGKNKGLLVVGSHNVTFSGFGKNLEISNIIKFEKDCNEDNLSLFNDAFNAFNAFKIWLTDYGNNTAEHQVLEAIENTLKLCPWLKKTGKRTLDNKLTFLFTSKSTESLWDQFQVYKPDETKQIIATAPFFDKKLDFIQTLLEQSNKSLILGVQPEEVLLSSQVFLLDGVKVVNSNSLTETDKKKEFQKKYIHAKAVYFDAGDNSVFISGSANLSSAAWLNIQSNANAEAVLVRMGNEAVDVSHLLGITALKEAAEVIKINNQQEQSNTNEQSLSKLAILSVGDDDLLRIEVQGVWLELIEIVYIDEWKTKYPIEFLYDNGQLLVEYKNIVRYGILTVLSNNVGILNIIVHKDADIKRCCRTADEQKNQEAWRSLYSEKPEIRLIFSCLEKLSCFKQNIQSMVNASPSSLVENNIKRELVVSLETEIKRNPKNGKIRNSQGDIYHILDLILYSLNNKSVDSSYAYSEDKFGRNEEDLIGSDDDTEIEILPLEAIDEQQRVAKLCRQKLKAMVNRLIRLLKNNQELALMLNSINAALVVNSILPVLSEASEKNNLLIRTNDYEWVTSETCEVLLNAIFEYIFIEKQTPLDFSSKSKDAVFLTDEADQLLSHVIWLMYRLGYTMKPMPSISMQVELGAIRNLQNARILFVFQRLIHDSFIEKTTIELFEKYTDKSALFWLKTLQSEVEKLIYDDDYSFCRGYGIVSSEKAFSGYRFSVFDDGPFTIMGSAKNTKHERILTKCLKIYK